MTARILNGETIAKEMRAELASEIGVLKSRGIAPGLGVLLVGDDPASHSYVAGKEKACQAIGIFSLETRLPADATLDAILKVVRSYNEDRRIHGILVQLPLPDESMEPPVIEAIALEKDADGFHPASIGRMMLGLPALLSCTPHGILQLLKRSNIAVAGAHVVVVGRSNLVGRPLANMLSLKTELGNATVTLCHSHTRDIGSLTRQADIVVAAAGRPGMITADMIRDGAVVVDVGVSRVPDASARNGYRLVGDVDFNAVKEKASAITPVPGGVGPMTITMLLYNTVQAARRMASGPG